MASSRQIILVTDALTRGRLQPALRRALARAQMSDGHDLEPMVQRVAEILGFGADHAAKASVRYLGDADQAPQRWVSGADPVYLEPRLDHLCLHNQATAVSQAELDEIVSSLNAALADDSLQFSRSGSGLYVESDEPLPTAELSASVIDGLIPNRYLAESSSGQTLRTEIEMVLHDHPVNNARAARGVSPVNSLWLWGGGEPADGKGRSLPLLMSDDASLVGYWRLNNADIASPPDSPSELPDSSDLVLAPLSDDQLWLAELLQGDADLTVLSRDGLTLRRRPSDRFRFWRRGHAILEADG